jgi:hypothetical protein
MSASKPTWPAHDDDGVWYCDAHGTYDCRRCAKMTVPTARELLDYDEPVWTYKLLAARVEAALALHQPDLPKAKACFCEHCGMRWPCPTVRLLDGVK